MFIPFRYVLHASACKWVLSLAGIHFIGILQGAGSQEVEISCFDHPCKWVPSSAMGLLHAARAWLHQVSVACIEPSG